MEQIKQAEQSNPKLLYHNKSFNTIINLCFRPFTNKEYKNTISGIVKDLGEDEHYIMPRKIIFALIEYGAIYENGHNQLAKLYSINIKKLKQYIEEQEVMKICYRYIDEYHIHFD